MVFLSLSQTTKRWFNFQPPSWQENDFDQSQPLAFLIVLTLKYTFLPDCSPYKIVAFGGGLSQLAFKKLFTDRVRPRVASNPSFYRTSPDYAQHQNGCRPGFPCIRRQGCPRPRLRRRPPFRPRGERRCQGWCGALRCREEGRARRARRGYVTSPIVVL